MYLFKSSIGIPKLPLTSSELPSSELLMKLLEFGVVCVPGVYSADVVIVGAACGVCGDADVGIVVEYGFIVFVFDWYSMDVAPGLIGYDGVVFQFVS